MVLASGGLEPEVFGPGVDEQLVFVVVDEEQHALELDITPEQTCWSPVVAFGLSFVVLSRLPVQEGFFGPAIFGSVGSVTQQEGSPILSISAQRHSARSSAAFHCAKGCSIPVQGVDRV